MNGYNQNYNQNYALQEIRALEREIKEIEQKESGQKRLWIKLDFWFWTVFVIINTFIFLSAQILMSTGGTAGTIFAMLLMFLSVSLYTIIWMYGWFRIIGHFIKKLPTSMKIFIFIMAYFLSNFLFTVFFYLFLFFIIGTGFTGFMKFLELLITKPIIAMLVTTGILAIPYSFFIYRMVKFKKR